VHHYPGGMTKISHMEQRAQLNLKNGPVAEPNDQLVDCYDELSVGLAQLWESEFVDINALPPGVTESLALELFHDRLGR
jgi:hypothetical protein